VPQKSNVIGIQAGVSPTWRSSTNTSAREGIAANTWAGNGTI
jgi:hypothetical protein